MHQTKFQRMRQWRDAYFLNGFIFHVKQIFRQKHSCSSVKMPHKPSFIFVQCWYTFWFSFNSEYYNNDLFIFPNNSSFLVSFLGICCLKSNPLRIKDWDSKRQRRKNIAADVTQNKIQINDFDVYLIHMSIIISGWS